MAKKPVVKSKGILDNYREEVDAYNKWMIKKQKQYGKDCMRPFRCWEDSDYQMVMRWNAQLNAIERVICLTEKEVEKEYKASCKRTGFKKIVIKED